MATHLRPHLPALHEKLHRAVGREDGEAQRQRGVRQVAAADVQQPGDGMRVGQDGGVLAGLAQGGGGGLALAGRGLAGVPRVLHPRRGKRRRRPVGPDRVDRVGGQRHQLDAGVARQRRLGMQPGVIPDPGLRRGLAQPARGGLLDQMPPLPQRRIGLLRHLRRVSAIGEDGGAVRQHDGQAGAAGEAGQPGQALAGGRNVFAEEFVVAGDEQAIEAEPCDLAAECDQPLFRRHSRSLVESERVFQWMAFRHALCLMADEKELADGPGQGQRGRLGAVGCAERIRTALGIEGGGELVLSMENGAMLAMTQMEAVRRVQRLLREALPEGVSVVDELIAERRQAAARFNRGE